MDALIWGGAFVTLLGLGGLLACIVQVARAKRAGLGDDALRAALRRIVTLNLAALLLSAFGLILVVAGILLG